MKNLILSLVIAIVSSVNVFGQGLIEFVHKTYTCDTKIFTLTNKTFSSSTSTYTYKVNDIIPDTNIYKLDFFINWGVNEFDSYTIVDSVITIYIGEYTHTVKFKEKILSVGSQVEVSNLTLYPNPVQDVLNIRFDSYENVDVVVTDLNGRIVYNENVSGLTSIDLSNQPTGIYLVNVGSTTRKVVKQ